MTIHDSTPPLTERLLAHSRRKPGGNGGNHRSANGPARPEMEPNSFPQDRTPPNPLGTDDHGPEDACP